MRFDDDKARPTHLVRTPPGYEENAVRYEVSDEYVDQAVAAVAELLPDGMKPQVGSIVPAENDEGFQDAIREHNEANETDALAEYATSMALDAHQQTTGTDLSGDAFDVEPDEDEDEAPVEVERRPSPSAPAKKAAAEKHEAKPKAEKHPHEDPQSSKP